MLTLEGPPDLVTRSSSLWALSAPLVSPSMQWEERDCSALLFNISMLLVEQGGDFNSTQVSQMFLLICVSFLFVLSFFCCSIQEHLYVYVKGESRNYFLQILVFILHSVLLSTRGNFIFMIQHLTWIYTYISFFLHRA